VHSQFIVNGEPTDSCLATATRGVWRLRLRARGRAAHSAFPDLGESAIDKLVDALIALRAVELPDDPALGRTHYVVGLVSGGIAPNVVPPEVNAEMMFWTVGPATDVRAAPQALPGNVEIEDELHVPVERFRVVPDFETRAFPFTTVARWTLYSFRYTVAA
jgi:acetylornithine deacetylase